MSVSWLVLPLHPAQAHMTEWLNQANIDVPPIHGRYPTLPELCTTLATFDRLPVFVEQSADDLWQVVLGNTPHTSYAHMLGSINHEMQFAFHFQGSWCEPSTMLEILRRLAVKCGGFVWCDDMTATPILITETSDVAAVLEAHNQVVQNKLRKAE